MENGSAIVNHIPELDGPLVPATTPLPLDIEKLKFIETEASTGELLKTAATLVITTAEEYTTADGFLGNVRKARNGVKARIAAFLDKNIRKAKELHQGLCDDRTAQQEEHEKPLIEIENKVIAMMRGYEETVKAEKKRLADLAEAKRQEDARIANEKAEQARKEQLEKDAADRLVETQRLAMEKLEKDQEAERLKAEGKTEEAAKATAAALEKAQQAAAVMAAPPPPAPAFIPPPPTVEPMLNYGSRGGCGTVVPKSKSLSGRKAYDWTGKDKMALIRAAAANPEAFAEFLDFNTKTLDARATSLKEKAGKTASGDAFPGVEFFEKIINAVRS